jgi:hypothetical protein
MTGSGVDARRVGRRLLAAPVKTRTRLVLALLALALLIIGGVEGGPYLWWGIQVVLHARVAAAREPAALAAWQQTFGDPDALEARFLRASDNPTAERLVVLARPLGIELEGASPAFPEWSAIWQYVAQAAQVSASGDLGGPPATVARYLDAHRSTISAVADLLATGDAPAWKCTVWSQLPLPRFSANVFSVLVLNRVLAAEALVAARDGRAAEADRTMQAAWQVGRSVRDQPQLVGQGMSLDLAAADLGVVRWTALDASPWRSRVDEYDDLAGMDRAIQMEVVKHIRADEARTFFQRAFLADYLDGMRANLQQERAVSFTDDPVAVPTLDKRPISTGIALADMWRAELDRAWRSALCTKLDVELTDRVLEARQARLTAGRWPATVPDASSAVVPNARWIYGLRAPDEISISLSRPLRSCSAPLRFDARR